jgi:transketolase
MEELRNFSGRPSVLVLRPADAAETTVAWQMAIENRHTPTALILSRQDIKDLPTTAASRFEAAQAMHRGGYVVCEGANPQVTLVANGSEVSLLCEVAELLSAEGIGSRVVSVPSLGLFNEQPKEYRESVIPSAGPVFGLTAGLPSTLRGVVGPNATIFGLDHFGASAPYKILDEKFGFTAQNILSQVKSILK